MELEKSELMNTIGASAKNLQESIDKHCSLVVSILEEQIDEHNLQLLLNRCPLRSREFALREAIVEAIDVLEDTRKAFKSKRLEVLRKKLTQVLIDAGQ